MHKLKSIFYRTFFTATALANTAKADDVFKNPITAGTFAQLVEELATAVRDIAIPIVVVFLIYAGFLFVSARGNETQLKKAKETFYWTIIGAVVVIGAYALAQAAMQFAQSL